MRREDVRKVEDVDRDLVYAVGIGPVIDISIYGPVNRTPIPVAIIILVRQLVTCKAQLTSANQIHIFTCVLRCHLHLSY